MDAQLAIANVAVAEAIASRDLAITAFDEKNDALATWRQKFPSTTREELVAYGKEVASPAIVYYTKQFDEENGDLHGWKTSSMGMPIV